MAMISLIVSTKLESRISVSRMVGDCISVTINTNIGGEESPIPYSRDTVFIHGDASDIRDFANKILGALPQDE